MRSRVWVELLGKMSVVSLWYISCAESQGGGVWREIEQKGEERDSGGGGDGREEGREGVVDLRWKLG